MRQNEKKVFGIIIGIAHRYTVGSLFAACNGSGKNNSNPSDKGESQTPETESPMFYEDMTFDYLYNLVKEAKSYTIVIKEIRYDAAADSDTAIWSETATASVDNVSKISYVETVNETTARHIRQRNISMLKARRNIAFHSKIIRRLRIPLR